MRFLVVDTASNNVLGAFEGLVAADALRIEIVGHNPTMAEYVQIVDVERALEAQRSVGGEGQAAAAGQLQLT